jgi:hypothetical protein
MSMKTVRMNFPNKEVMAVAALLAGIAFLSLVGYAQAQLGSQASRLHALPDPVLPWGDAAVPLLGWIAACLTLCTFACADGLRLRVAALSANAAFVAYGSMAGLMPVLALHLALIPVNLWRLAGVLRSLRAASVSALDSPGEACRPRRGGHVKGGASAQPRRSLPRTACQPALGAVSKRRLVRARARHRLHSDEAGAAHQANKSHRLGLDLWRQRSGCPGCRALGDSPPA